MSHNSTPPPTTTSDLPPLLIASPTTIALAREALAVLNEAAGVGPAASAESTARPALGSLPIIQKPQVPIPAPESIPKLEVRIPVPKNIPAVDVRHPFSLRCYSLSYANMFYSSFTMKMFHSSFTMKMFDSTFIIKIPSRMRNQQKSCS
jgi:hypothetical protein